MFTDELLYACALNKVFNFRPADGFRLIEMFGSAKGVLTLKKSDLFEIFGKEYKFFEELTNKSLLISAEKELRWCEENDFKVLFFKDHNYPARLREIPDPPLILYVKGNANLNHKFMLSIVGTRRVTQYGEAVCAKLIAEVASMGSGCSIVSGLAFGTDINAHRSAVSNGLPTIAVLPCGPERVYPTSHRKAADVIAEKGAVVTDYPLNTDSLKINFIRRNRIIAALSQATIVIESAKKGGALITARVAQSYGREVYAVPGRVFDKMSEGCNELISDNIANSYLSAKRVFEELKWESRNSLALHERSLFGDQITEKEKILITLSKNSPASIDELSIYTKLTIRELTSFLLELELDGRVERVTGGKFIVR